MAKTVVTEDMTGVSGSVPASLHAAMEDARWGYKRNMSQMVRAAVEFYAVSEGFWTPPAPITSDDPELSDDQRAAVLADEERAAKAAEDNKADGDVEAAKVTAAKLAEDKAAADKAAEDKAAADKAAEDKAAADAAKTPKIASTGKAAAK